MRRWLSLVVVSTCAAACAVSRGRLADPAVDPNPPTTLAEALDRLEGTLPPETLQKMRDGTEREMALYHFSVGLRMRNTWGLWGRGPLYDHLAALGLRHPDDMSGIILTSLWRRLHGQPLRVEEEVARYREYWRVALDPDPRSNTACSSPIMTTVSWGAGWGAESADAPLRGVHMGKCCADGGVWSYHVDRGWYRPTDAELGEWNRDDGRYDPCKK